MSEDHHHGEGNVGLMRLSLIIGLGMLAMKVYAYWITRSAAIFSDAAESVVHNLAVGFALYSQWYSNRPSDKNHLYGHEKIGYFSAGFEGALIFGVGIFIIYDAIQKWLAGLALQNLNQGIGFTIAATAINAALGGYLVWRGKKSNSIIVTANGYHVLTDSWTSLGVIAGLVLVKITGWLPFDPICAIAVASNILFTGFGLVRSAVAGLMDEADLRFDEVARKALDEETAKRGVHYHELKHRKAGPVIWMEVHLLFSDETPLREAHRVATDIEEAVARRLEPGVRITTHLEPLDDHQRIHSHSHAPVLTDGH